jgi:hypothetical protein
LGDRSAETVSHAATRLIRNNSPETAHTQLPDNGGSKTAELLGDLKKIIMGLQFHDELTQRINHIQTLLKLIQDQSNAEKPDCDPTKLLTMVSGIFSSGAEFKQLGKVFPEYNAANDTDLIELF